MLTACLTQGPSLCRQNGKSPTPKCARQSAIIAASCGSSLFAKSRTRSWVGFAAAGVAGAGAALFARALGVRPVAATLAALAYLTSGYLISMHAGHYYLASAALLRELLANSEIRESHREGHPRAWRNLLNRSGGCRTVRLWS